jgi:hypothetical protein
VLKGFAARVEGTFGWATGNPVAALGVAGVLVFGLLRLAYYLFYRHLGVTPEDAGFGYSETLIDASFVTLGLLVIALVGLAGVALPATLGILLVGIPIAIAAIVVSIVLYFVFIALWIVAFLSALVPGVSNQILSGAFDPVGSAITKAGDRLAWSLRLIRRALLSLSGSERRPLRVVAITSAFLLAIVGIGAYVAVSADRNGEAAAHGKSTKGVRPFGIPLLDVRAETAMVSWVGGSKKPDTFRSCLTYLGQSESNAVFFDVAGRHPLRLPASNVTVSTGPCVRPWLNSYKAVELPKSKMAYRVYGGESQRKGPWVTPAAPKNEESARAQLALPPTNTAQCVVTLRIPAGTEVRMGHTGPGFDEPGGGPQIEIIGSLNGVKYLRDGALSPGRGPCP